MIPTFHPAAALRGGDRVKGQMREDFALVRSVLESPLEPPRSVEPEQGLPEDRTDQLELFG